MFYAFITNNKINGKGQCECTGEDTFSIEITEEVYNNLDHYIYSNGEIILNPNYEQEQAQKRQQEFLKDFFKVPLSSQFTQKEYAYYRKTPKGYSSAIESINTAERMCSKMQGLPANILIFYEEPDFYDETQCTEEWLENHQIKLPALTPQEFDDIYITFITAWNTQQHLENSNDEVIIDGEDV